MIPCAPLRETKSLPNPPRRQSDILWINSIVKLYYETNLISHTKKKSQAQHTGNQLKNNCKHLLEQLNMEAAYIHFCIKIEIWQNSVMHSYKKCIQSKQFVKQCQRRQLLIRCKTKNNLFLTTLRLNGEIQGMYPSQRHHQWPKRLAQKIACKFSMYKINYIFYSFFYMVKLGKTACRSSCFFTSK